MKHYDEYIIQLIQLYLVGDLSGEEKVKLEEWVSQDPSHEKLFKEICDEKNVAHDFGIYENVNKFCMGEGHFEGKHQREA